MIGLILTSGHQQYPGGEWEKRERGRGGREDRNLRGEELEGEKA